MILLDTNVLIRIDDVLLPEDDLVVSALSYAELRFGVQSASDAEQRRRRRATITRIEQLLAPSWLPFTDRAAEAYAALAATVSKVRPAHARSIDTLLAGHALSLGAGVLTLNPKDFELVADELPIVVPKLR
ncbi:hypothetical protein GCM10025768_02530 [Microbacterium pseudoresistens]|uniref:Ribonuclease VapC n=1 Tax=Microbacterium pseudoresistens TaxID=640634 RepID=A0A7Y9EU98_9MICO|nr:type II toxin-antitoxin system VapC family toxin [Microbacterium pseudoresistens]NYD54088.1 putative nucleic acid-binding protein [Microbacterium pseudoresistens]